MAFCVKCGFQLQDDFLFCPRCAAPVVRIEQMNNAQINQNVNVQPIQYTQPIQNEQNNVINSCNLIIECYSDANNSFAAVRIDGDKMPLRVKSGSYISLSLPNGNHNLAIYTHRGHAVTLQGSNNNYNQPVLIQNNLKPVHVLIRIGRVTNRIEVS